MSSRKASPARSSDDRSAYHSLFVALGDRRRRRIVALAGELGPIPDDRLAARLAAEEGDGSPDAVPEGEYESVLVELQHLHLPKLEEAGLVERSRGAVAPTDHRVYDERSPVDLSNDGRVPDDRVFRRLADRRNRDILSILADEPGETAVSELVERLAEREHDPGVGALADTERRVRTSLHHNNLPALAEDGLIEYDRDRGTVAYRGRSDVDDRWLEPFEADGRSPGDG